MSNNISKRLIIERCKDRIEVYQDFLDRYGSRSKLEKTKYDALIAEHKLLLKQITNGIFDDDEDEEKLIRSAINDCLNVATKLDRLINHEKGNDQPIQTESD